MFWSFLFLKQIPLSNGCKYPMLWGYRMRCSWLKRNKLVPNQNLTNEKPKIDRKFKQNNLPFWIAPRMIAKCKRGSPSARLIFKQNDFCIPCIRWHVFLFSINVNKNENTNPFRLFLMSAAILFQKSYVVTNGLPTLPPPIRRKH